MNGRYSVDCVECVFDSAPLRADEFVLSSCLLQVPDHLFISTYVEC